MATSTSRTTATEKARAKRRARVVPFEDHVLSLRKEAPELFEDYDPVGIAQALLESGALKHDNVMLELAEANLQTFRRRYDPHFDNVQRGPSKRLEPPKVGDAVAAFWDSVTPNTILHGRRLKDWKVGELRREHRSMGNFLARFAHKRDDELVGDDWE